MQENVRFFGTLTQDKSYVISILHKICLIFDIIIKCSLNKIYYYAQSDPKLLRKVEWNLSPQNMVM